MKYNISTLGCKVNIFESESVSNVLDKHGYKRVFDDEVADVYIINTCTVTNKSDSKSRKVIRNAIRTNPDAIIVVMGCYAQLAKDEISTIDGVDIILGNDDKNKIYDIIESYKNQNKQLIVVSDIMRSKVMSDLGTDTFYENTRAFLKIQDGCNNFCSFCIIPFARGLMRSKPSIQVINEINTLVKNGYKEVVLTGIHTGGYGVDFDNYNITDLIVDILDKTDLQRLRISSIEINQLSDKLINLINDNHRMAKHLHIPIQSGCDEILLSMKRNYDTKKFTNKIAKIKSIIKGVSITTDIIVGYPTESADNFEESYNTCVKIGFSELHVFPYSKRNGTIAAKLKQTNDQIKKDRSEKLMKLSKELKQKYYMENISNQDLIIVETIKDGYAFGKTGNYINVKVIDNGYVIGQLLNISISRVGKDNCLGVVIDE
ncbi:MAG: tRNA (N(6)-L-threonylcarbamoyladenosine(37)-C(2))-methylthiotransferase MtaB [Bacilli bacterium]